MAFSGGGTRSASATLGQLRALHELGLDRRLWYISAVSGGSWAAVPYAFLPPEIDDAAFLGPYVPPEAIDDTALGVIDGSALGLAITRADLAPGFLRSALLGGFDENYAGALERVFLQPFGLGGDRPPRFFTLDGRSLGRILARNPRLAPDDFHLVRPDRPFLIVGGAIVPGRSNDAADRYPFDMTPLYVGTPVGARIESRISSRFDLPVGGGYVEAFAYDSERKGADGAPPSIYRVEIERDRNRFSLADVIATSGAAPVDLTARLGFVAAKVLGFPQYEHWPVDDRQTALFDRAYNHGDGGLVDNVGLMPLLARGVENIIVFVNTREAFAPPDATGDGRLYGDVVSFFVRDPGAAELENVVFEDGRTRLRELRAAFAALKSAARPLVHCATYRVRPNPRYNIHAAYEPNVCWVYLDATEAWFRALRRAGGEEGETLLGALAGRRGRFERLPHYETFFENRDVRSLFERLADARLDPAGFRERVRAFKESDFRVVKLRPEQVTALANLAAWTVCESVDVFKAAIPGVFSEGAIPRCTRP